MRTLDQNIITELEKAVTTPTLLVYFGFDTAVRLSSRGDINWDGHNWKGGVIKGNVQIKGDPISGIQGTVNLINTDRFFTGLVLNEGGSGKDCEVYQYFVDSDDAIKIFKGQIDNFSSLDEVANAQLNSTSSSSWCVSRKLTLKDYPYLLQPGTSLKIGNIDIVIGYS